MEKEINPEVELKLSGRLDIERRRIVAQRGEGDGRYVLRLAVQAVRNWAILAGIGVNDIEGWTDRVMPDYRKALYGYDESVVPVVEMPFPAALSAEDYAFAELTDSGRLSVEYLNGEFDAWRVLAYNVNLELSKRTGWAGSRPMSFKGSGGLYFELEPEAVRVMRSGSEWGVIYPDKVNDSVVLTGFEDISDGNEKVILVNTIMGRNNIQHLQGRLHGVENYNVYSFGQHIIVATDRADQELRSAFVARLGAVEFMSVADSRKMVERYLASRSKAEGEMRGPALHRDIYAYNGRAVCTAEEKALSIDEQKHVAAKDRELRAELFAKLEGVVADFKREIGVPDMNADYVLRGAATLVYNGLEHRYDLETFKGRHIFTGGGFDVFLGGVRFRAPGEDGTFVTRKRYASVDDAVASAREFLWSHDNVSKARKALAALKEGRSEGTAQARPRKKGHGIR